MVTTVPGQVYALHTTVREFMATAIEQRQAMSPLGRSFTRLYQPVDRGQNKRRPCLVLSRQQVANTNGAVVTVALLATFGSTPADHAESYARAVLAVPMLSANNYLPPNTIPGAFYVQTTPPWLYHPQWVLCCTVQCRESDLEEWQYGVQYQVPETVVQAFREHVRGKMTLFLQTYNHVVATSGVSGNQREKIQSPKALILIVRRPCSKVAQPPSTFCFSIPRDDGPHIYIHIYMGRVNSGYFLKFKSPFQSTLSQTQIQKKYKFKKPPPLCWPTNTVNLSPYLPADIPLL